MSEQLTLEDEALTPISQIPETRFTTEDAEVLNEQDRGNLHRDDKGDTQARRLF